MRVSKTGMTTFKTPWNDPSEYEGPESYHENWGEDHEDLDHQDGDDWPDLE